MAGVSLGLECCGESIDIDTLPFTIGREADYVVADDPDLPGHFLQLFAGPDGAPMLANIGSELTATVSDADGRMGTTLVPGAVMPVLPGETLVRFAAGSSGYELTIERGAASPVPELADHLPEDPRVAVVEPVGLTEDQTLLLLSIAEFALRTGTSAVPRIPTTVESARRIGWTTTTFNRTLGGVCEELARHGIGGLRGDSDTHPSHRKAHLVEYVLTSRILTEDDLPLLDAAPSG